MWWNSATVKVEQRGGTVEQWLRHSVVEQCNREGGTVVEEWNSDGESVWLNSGTVMVEQCGETVDQ